jgi:site-specific recombinase XerD
MKLHALVTQYIAFRESFGEDFCSQARLLRQFSRDMGTDLEANEIEPERVKTFLDGTRPLSSYWHRKQSILRGFYRYAITRGLVASSPLPTQAPKRPPALTPYIYTHEELRRLLEATISLRHANRQLEPTTFRVMLLLLYGAGLRLCEALALNRSDYDPAIALMTIRDTKFHKTRLVPLGADLNQALATYMAEHHRTETPVSDRLPLFPGRDGARLTDHAVRKSFRRLRTTAGVQRSDGASYQPRLHDLRHSFAVHRLTAWYQAGADVQKLLPHLSTYLGHVNVAATQVYLTMTPELLQLASERFAQYAFQEVTHD